MSKSLRLPEKWFRRGLWLVALVFAFFLIGLGGLVVGNLPQPDRSLEVESFIPRPMHSVCRPKSTRPGRRPA
jgi:hypothetical protein